MIKTIQQSQLISKYSHEAIVITDRNNRIISVNNAFEKITKYSKDEVIGKEPTFLKSGKHSKEFYYNMWTSVQKNGFWEGEIWNKNKLNEIYPEFLTIIANQDESGEIENYIAVFSDITKIKEYEKKLDILSKYDQLTGLLNKENFQENINDSIKHSSRLKQKFAVILIDIDRLKYINDTFGLDVGDKILIEISKRLTQTIRGEDSVARIEGDEFGIIVNHIEFDKQLAVALNRIIHAINKPLEVIENKSIHITSSLGIALYPDDTFNDQELFNNANTALYRAKKQGNTFVFYKNKYTKLHKEKLELFHDLKEVLLEGKLEVYYQPQIDVAKNIITGIEALVRWKHDEKGFIPPMDFIKVAEEFRIILQLTHVVFEKAFTDYKFLQDQGFEGNLSLNLSPLQLQDKSIIDDIEKLIFAHGINPAFIEIEVTENAIIENLTIAKEVLIHLKQIGFRISLDDFGQGATSLLHLKEFPIDKLKIDKQFVDNIMENDKDKMLLKTLIQLGNNMNFDVIIEGVETEQQLELVLDYGCKFVQGFIFSKPLVLEDIEVYIQNSTNYNDFFENAIKQIESNSFAEYRDKDLNKLIENIKHYQIDLEKQMKKMDIAQNQYQRIYEEFRTIFELAPIGYCIVDERLQIEKYNHYFEQIIKYSGHQYINLYFNNESNHSFRKWITTLNEKEVKSKSFRLLDNNTFIKIYGRVFSTHRSKKYFISLSDITRDIQKNNELYSLNHKLNNMVQQEVAKNIEQEKQHYEDMIKASQYSTIGKMASGLTHEINTPLTVIKGNIEMIKCDADESSDSSLKKYIYESIEKIDHSIDRIYFITQSLKELSGENTLHKNKGNIYDTLLSALRFTYMKSKHITNIYINDKLFPDEVPKKYPIAYSNIQTQRIEQIWVSIITNALDELIKIDDFDKRRLDIILDSNDKYNIIKFIDNAGGIDENILQDIFLPFNSNKTSSGIGLGLNICEKVLRDHKGTIEARNENNKAVFVVKLPKVESNA